jgi:ABC-type nitrate/sulfonate/bicarbonate transport system permease component
VKSDARTRHLHRLLGCVVLVLAWEANARFETYRIVAADLPPTFFPRSSDILLNVVGALRSAQYLEAAALTLERVAGSFFAAALGGVLLALAAARSEIADNILHYPTEFMRQLPAVAVVPFAIMFFGIGTPMKLALGILGALFPIYAGTRDGLRTVDPLLMLTARAYGWKGPQLIFGVMLPAATPGILAAMRIALAIVLILVVMAEMLVGGDGLGARIVVHERTFEFPALYAETLLLGAIGIALSAVFGSVARRVHFWHVDGVWAAPNPLEASKSPAAQQKR